MKKILVAALALAMLLVSLSALAEDGIVELYKSDFTLEGMDGWFANNAQGAVTEECAFLITGRS